MNSNRLITQSLINELNSIKKRYRNRKKWFSGLSKHNKEPEKESLLLNSELVEYSKPNIHENPIDKSTEISIVKSKEITEDGAPKGNNNAAGPHRRSKMSNADKAKYRKRLQGQTTSDGIKIKVVTDHALDRAAQRNISPKQIESMISSSKVSPDKERPDSRRCYDIKGKRMVVDFLTGEIVTVEKRRQNK